MDGKSKRMDKKGGKLNNSGFTLVELLIAMVILTIIIVPIMNSLVTSFNTNQRSRRTMQSTSVAEDVMENFEAHDIDTMIKYFENINSLTSGYQILFPNGAGNKSKVEIFSRVENATSGVYDVWVELDSTGVNYKDINEQEIADIQNLSTATNAVYVDSLSDINYAYGFFYQFMNDDPLNPSYSTSYVADRTDRFIDIKVSTYKKTFDINGVPLETDVKEVYANVKFQYKDVLVGGSTTYPQNGKSFLLYSNADYIASQIDDIKAGTLAEEDLVTDLANIILCVYPREYSAGKPSDPNKCGKDYITIDNRANLKTSVYLAVQGDDTKVNSTNYAMEFNVIESMENWIESSGSDAKKAYCKLRTNLLNNTGTGIKFVYTNADMKVGGEYANSGVNIALAKEMLQADTLTPQRKYNRLYDIKVNVYLEDQLKGISFTDAGGNVEADIAGKIGVKPLITMTGTVTDSISAE